MTLRDFTVVSWPIWTRPSTRAPSSMVPSIFRSMSSIRRRFASRMSSGFPVSFHHPFTMCALTRPTAFRKFSRASVISNSFRKDGLRLRITGNTFYRSN